MNLSEKTSLILKLHQIGCIQFGEFILKSGQRSTVYLNLRKIISYPQLLATIAEAMWLHTQNSDYDLVCGVPYTALPIATALSLAHDVPMIMRRKEKKDYGTKQLIEGEFKVKQRCLVIEDVITTGGSILETTNDLIAHQLQVQDVIALIDREQGGKQALEKQYRVHTLLTMTDILQTLLLSAQLSQQEKIYIQTYLHEQVTC